MIAAPADAQRDDARDEREARRAYARCGEAEGFEAPPVLTLDDEDYADVHFVQRGPRWLVHYATWGNGVDAGYAGWSEMLDPRSCARLRYEWATSDGAMRSESTFRWHNRGAPTDEEVRELAAERGQVSNPAHALARLRLAQRCHELPGITAARAWELAGPIAPAQPWLAGRPATPVSTFWPNPQQTPGTLGGVTVPALSAPARVRQAGALELWSSSASDRNGAQAIAVYDPRADRHRWLVLTRGCIQGTRVRWIAAEGPFVIGITESRHPVYQDGDGVLVLDLQRGLAFRWAPGFGPPSPILADLLAAPARASFFLELAERSRERAARPAWMGP